MFTWPDDYSGSPIGYRLDMSIRLENCFIQWQHPGKRDGGVYQRASNRHGEKRFETAYFPLWNQNAHYGAERENLCQSSPQLHSEK